MKANPTQPAQTAWTPLEFSLASERLITWSKQTNLEQRSGYKPKVIQIKGEKVQLPFKGNIFTHLSL